MQYPIGQEIRAVNQGKQSDITLLKKLLDAAGWKTRAPAGKVDNRDDTVLLEAIHPDWDSGVANW